MKINKYIITALALTTYSLKAQVPVWAAGAISGMGSIVSAVGLVASWYGDYEGYTVDTSPIEYTCDNDTNYPLSGHKYSHRWTVFESLNKSFVYTYTMTDNGATIASNHDPFQLIFTKRNWSCSQCTPTLCYSSSSKSTLKLRSVYIITRAANYSWSVPQGAYFTVKFSGTQLAENCGTGGGMPQVASDQKWVPRASKVEWDYTHVNLAADGWMSIAK